MSLLKKLTSVVLSACMTLSVSAVGTVSVTAESEQDYTTYAQDTIVGSAILHCWNWSYNNIKANLAEIAAAGYTAVQTSPVQPPKDYNSSYTSVKDNWWKLYQPLDLNITDGENYNSWLGSKEELKELCTEADRYGIKVVVDIVANHLANNGNDGGTFDRLHSNVPEDMQHREYYHDDTSNDNITRYNTTQCNIGMPDLNTQNSYVQQKALQFLKDCVDCGVDGFRFDAAKHIELPTDDASFKGNFWPVVVNGVKEYADNNGYDEPYIYGEILGSADTAISNYTKYMAVTDNYAGDRALYGAYTQNTGRLADSTNQKQTDSASQCVLWVESHDTYAGTAGSDGMKTTSDVSDDVITKAWAIVGSRADSTSLFFARPTGIMGEASTDTTWKSTAVAEVNKFKNVFEGKSEYLSYSGKVAYNERGTKGVVISKLNGDGSVSLTAHKMVDGTYTDHVTGNTFTVSNGTISGTVGSTGVAVVYNDNDVSEPTFTANTLYLDPGKWNTDSAVFAVYVYNSNTKAENLVYMTDSDNDGIYEANLNNTQWTKLRFQRMSSDKTTVWNQTTDYFLTGGNNLYTIPSTLDKWNGDIGEWEVNCNHEYGSPSVNWNSNYTAATATFTCSKCEHSKTIDATVTPADADDEHVAYAGRFTFGNTTYTSTVTLSATKFYLNPNSKWTGSRFAVYVWNDKGDNWLDMSADSDGHYYVKIPYVWKNMIFCEMESGTTENDWSNKSSQTVDITIPRNGNNLYTLTGGSDNSYTGAWSTHDVVDCEHTYGEPEWSWSADYSTATATFTCTKCGSGKQTVDATVTSEDNGSTITYTASVAFNGRSYIGTKTVEKEESEGTVLYLVPNSNWKTDDAQFALYTFDDNGNSAWTDMTKKNDNVYSVAIPDGNWTKLIFCRMNPARTENRWNENGESGKVKPVWGQTVDITIPTNENNCYTIIENSDAWTNVTGSWSTHSHTYGEPVWTWSDYHNSASVKFTCSFCSDTQTVDADIESTVNGSTITYTATAAVKGTTYTDTQEATLETFDYLKIPKGMVVREYADGHAAYQTEHADELYAAFESALAHGDTKIYVDIQRDELIYVVRALQSIYPELFFVSGSMGYGYDANSNYVEITYTMNLEETNAKLKAFYEKAEWYLSHITDDMDDFTKALVLHDLLVLNNYYPLTQEEMNAANNYDFMVNGWGVCQNYTEIYAYLLAHAGIKSEIINSDSMNHAWLKVCLNGSYYNVDATWDDPRTINGVQRFDKVYHTYFLLSDTLIRDSTYGSNGSHHDYTAYHAANDTTYDSYSTLHDMENPIFRINGELYTIYNGQIGTYTNNTFTSKYTITDNWGGWGNYSGIAEYNGELYFNDSNHIYVYDSATNTAVTYVTRTEDGKAVYGMYIENGVIHGLVAANPNAAPTDVEIANCKPAVSWQWADDYSSAAATFTSVDGNTVETVNVTDITSEITKAATCTTEGTVVYTAFVTYQGLNYTSTTTAILTDNDNHTYGSPVWSWSQIDGEYKASMKTVCSECGDVKTYSAQTESSNSNGVITYTATATVGGNDYTSTMEVNESYTFNVVDGTITSGEKDSYSYGDAVKVNAEETNGKNCFSGWYIGDTRITTKQSYTFYVKSDMTVTAKYEGDAVMAEQADVSVMITRTNIANDKQKVVFALNWALPEGCTLKEAFIVRKYDDSVNLDYEHVDGTTVKKNTSTLRTRNGNCNFNLTVSATTKSRSVNAVAYVIYTDTSGQTQTVCSSVQTSEY